MRAWEDLTNVQFPMLNSHPKGEAAAYVRSCLASVEHSAIRHPLRMRIEHWELSIGQIPSRIQGSGFCQVILREPLVFIRNIWSVGQYDRSTASQLPFICPPVSSHLWGNFR